MREAERCNVGGVMMLASCLGVFRAAIWGPAGKGGGTESGYPACVVLPCEQHFGVVGKLSRA